MIRKQSRSKTGTRSTARKSASPQRKEHGVASLQQITLEHSKGLCSGIRFTDLATGSTFRIQVPFSINVGTTILYLLASRVMESPRIGLRSSRKRASASR